MILITLQCNISLDLYTVVIVAFLQLQYAVNEGDGQVEVCVILRGQTERDITVTVSTMSGIASGR